MVVENAGDELNEPVIVLLDVDVENGFVNPDELPVGLTPNKLSPILVEVMAFICVCEDAGFDSIPPLAFRRSLANGSEIRTPRNVRILPSLRLHVFRLQVSTYNRLSCPGNFSGKSPFSCRSKTIRSLHTPHLARAADGGMAGSSQVC